MLRQHTVVRICRLFMIAACILSLHGCGGGGSESGESSESSPAQVQQQAGSQDNQSTAQATSQAQKTEVDPNRKETKWIGDIPYDVFYEQPLMVAADTTVIGGGNTTAPPSNGTPAMANNDTSHSNTSEPPPAESSAGGGAVDWGTTIPMTMLQEELKAIRTRLTANLQSVGNYNRNAEAIALDGAIVAGLGAVVTVHPEADTWKDRGKFIRDLGYEIYSNAGPSGRAAFTATEEPFLKLQTAMDGGTVDGVDAQEGVPFGDVIYVSDMMQRIEFTYNNLKANINTEARMKEDPAAVQRDLHMLAAMGTIMGTESYENVENPGYQKLIAAFVGGALQGVDAVKTENFDSFRDGLNKIQTTCSECHQQYRGADSGF